MQVGLAQNQQLLLKQGIFAPPGHRFEKNLAGGVSGGNAKQLIGFGRSLRDGAQSGRRDPEKRLRKWLEDILADPTCQAAETIIFSGEAIPGSLDIPAFEQLKTVLNDYASEITCIYYVRHLCDHAVSQYGEYVRRRRMKDTFSEFALEYEAPFMGSISKMEQVFGAANVKVVSFEVERENLWPNFVRMLGADPEGMRLPVEVNRSLCAEEILLIRELNQLGIRRALLAKTLSNYSASIGPATKNRLIPTLADIEAINQNHTTQLGYVNARLPTGSVLKPASDALVQRAMEHSPSDNSELPFSNMRALLIAALTTFDTAMTKREESDVDD